MATVDPYQVLKESYDKRTAAINQVSQQQEADRIKREQQAQETLTNANRGVYTSFQKQINPYGSFANQNNFSSGVSDYYKNASYGTMLQGIGTNQYNYNDAINNSNSLWQNYLAEKAGQEADALNDYNAAVLAQQQEDERIKREKEAEEEAIRQFNLQLQLKQEQEAAEQARWEAEQAENKRRYDQEWAYQMSLAKGGSGSGSGGSSTRSSSPRSTDDFSETPTPNPAPKTGSSRTGSQQYKEPGKIARTGYEPSSIPGMRYSVAYDSRGKVIKRTLVRDPKSKVKGRVYRKKY